MNENIKKLKENLEKILNDETERYLKNLRLKKEDALSALEILTLENVQNIEWLRKADDALRALNPIAHQITPSSELEPLGSSIDFPDFNKILQEAEREIEDSINEFTKRKGY